MNPYGHFDDANREYVMTRPDTPLPWLNYLGSDDFFGLCTNTAGGYTFWRDAKLRRLTRYRYNNVPYDLGGRYLYVNDGGDVWNPMWKPVKAALDRYECRHGMGYTRIVGARGGVEVESLFFVPNKENCELWDVTVRNTTDAPKTVRLYSFQEFCFYEALNDMTNYQRTYSIGEVEVEGSAIYHKTEYRERRSHYTLFACTGDITGFDTSRDAFVGIHEGLHEAKVPFAGQATGSRAFGWNPIGSHELTLELAPGEETNFAFILAYVDQGDEPKFDAPMVMNRAVGRALVEKYSAPGAVAEAFTALQKGWEDLLGKFQVDCPNEHATRMVNSWNQYQCMATFNLSRSASMYESGIGRGMGYRDSNQDLLGFVHMIPERARERILDIARTQLSDGTCFHQYQPLTKQGNADIGGDFYDDHLWLVLSVCAYIKETGDFTILEADAGYADNPEAGTDLLHHLETSIAYTMAKRGPHKLPLIGHADWNDCLNLNCFSTEPNESFQTAGDVEDSQAESVMIAGLFLYASREMAALYRALEREADAARMDGCYAEMLKAVETHAWDGEWYTRAFDAAGKPVGSHVCEEGKIFIESQGWCVIGGAGAGNGRARQAMESVDKHLFTPNGVVLQQPAYSDYHLELGEVTSYPPGVKENAGIFSHNNTWIHLGWCVLGEGEKALQYYLSICPSAKEDQIETYRSEPYVYPQMIAGKDAPCFGEAKNSWLTGTAAWTFVVASQGILGIQPDYEGLRIDPCIPSDWEGFTATRSFRGVQYEISVKNPEGVCKGVTSLTVDGEAVSGNVAPLVEGRDSVTVEVVLG
ncbi:MAG: GH36-type glycosyl hydrolase domain-containing protein [Planctomycetota bacterium]|jgi:cellobiose phosphorylase